MNINYNVRLERRRIHQIKCGFEVTDPYNKDIGN